MKKIQLNCIEKVNLNIDNQTEPINEKFLQYRELLNNTKDLFNTIPSNSFNQLSRYVDAFRTIKNNLYKTYSMQIVTNASLKIYEIISQFKLLNPKLNNVFCNAELPGGFIMSINHYIKTMYPNSNFNWLASSFINQENTLTDLYHIYKYNKDNWIMDNTINGDLTNPLIVVELANRVHKRFINGATLYTSDIGTDVSSNFNLQEEQTLTLNYGQVLCGLLSLAINGNMVTKQFTFFTPFNRSLLILLCNLFKKVFITKPATSKTLNSEIYIVSLGFKGLNEEVKSYLLKRLSSVDQNVPLIWYSSKCDTKLLNIAKKIYNIQMEYIRDAVYLYNSNKDSIQHIQKIMEDININTQNKWLIDNPMKKLEIKNYIPSNVILK
jgi:23S rRNA U2552 (ribose-2'-O)-methylase RlmE/FtsJ